MGTMAGIYEIADSLSLGKRHLEIELTRHDIPFVKRGGFQFMETAHIKDMLAHLRVISNPMDAVSWGRVLMLLEGVGPQMSRKLIEQLLGDADPAECLRRIESGGRAKQPLKTLGQVLGECSERTRPADMAQYLMQYYLPILKRKHADDYPKRLRDLEHFQGLTERYQSIERLLSDMALDPPSASVDEGPLVLSTVHSAKGLEWHSVFIIWALEGRFPSYYNTNSIEELRDMAVTIERLPDVAALGGQCRFGASKRPFELGTLRTQAVCFEPRGSGRPGLHFVLDSRPCPREVPVRRRTNTGLPPCVGQHRGSDTQAGRQHPSCGRAHGPDGSVAQHVDAPRVAVAVVLHLIGHFDHEFTVQRKRHLRGLEHAETFVG